MNVSTQQKKERWMLSEPTNILKVEKFIFGASVHSLIIISCWQCFEGNLQCAEYEFQQSTSMSDGSTSQNGSNIAIATS